MRAMGVPLRGERARGRYSRLLILCRYRAQVSLALQCAMQMLGRDMRCAGRVQRWRGFLLHSQRRCGCLSQRTLAAGGESKRRPSLLVFAETRFLRPRANGVRRDTVAGRPVGKQGAFKRWLASLLRPWQGRMRPPVDRRRRLRAQTARANRDRARGGCCASSCCWYSGTLLLHVLAGRAHAKFTVVQRRLDAEVRYRHYMYSRRTMATGPAGATACDADLPPPRTHATYCIYLGGRMPVSPSHGHVNPSE